MIVLVTGANGFIGKNLCTELARRVEVQLIRCHADSRAEDLERGLSAADVVFHLAGVNRPQHIEEFRAGNVEVTRDICHRLTVLGRRPKLVLSSSVHAEGETPYGVSKREAEDTVRRYAEESGANGVVFRLKNIFGKWCRPGYNSVVATFCHNVARGLPIQISDPDRAIDLTYVDDVVAAFLAELHPRDAGFYFANPLPSHEISLGDLANLIVRFSESRKTLLVPDLSQPFIKALYSTYLSHIPSDECAYTLEVKADDRGSLAELLKSPTAGQVFISRTRPGITRGNHYHQTKVEKFVVVQGEAVIRLRQIHGEQVLQYRVRGEEYKVLDIPPGFTHSIENVGVGELVTLFWANEIFDPSRPDTVFLPVGTQ